MLLSATLDGDVDKLVRTHLRDPALHELDPNAGSVTTMTHHTLTVGGFRDKVDAAVRLVEANGRTIVFTRTREGAVELAEALTDQGVDAVDLHGNLSQQVRERNLHRFSSGQAQVVVATDVAARGIHVDDVGLVVHFDAAGDAKSYLHRSGRTARAGSDGGVVTMTTPKSLSRRSSGSSRTPASRCSTTTSGPLPSTSRPQRSPRRSPARSPRVVLRRQAVGRPQVGRLQGHTRKPATGPVAATRVARSRAGPADRRSVVRQGRPYPSKRRPPRADQPRAS